MFHWFKQKQPTEALSSEQEGYLARLRQGLSKTRQGLMQLFGQAKKVDEALLEELETLLLMADLGMEVTEKVLQQLRQNIKKHGVEDAEQLRALLAEQLEALLLPLSGELESVARPQVILMVGVNGAGKTTSIGKLAHYFQAQGKKVMLAAGDTFRAAAVEQLQVWGERNGIPVLAQGTGADAAAVAYDALQAAMARNIDVLLIDTAGRLHTQDHLMAELQKIKRVLGKLIPEAPHETLLVLDAGNGHNALRQAKSFHEALGLTGIILTKLDGTAKGGMIFAIAEHVAVPFRFIGVGEGKEDLRLFKPSAFVRALLYND